MFLFRLAGHLGMTVSELCDRMTSAELSEWMALDMFHRPLPDPWRQTGVLASAVLAPHCGRGKTPKADDFVPVARLPQTQDEMLAELQKLQRLAKGGR